MRQGIGACLVAVTWISAAPSTGTAQTLVERDTARRGDMSLRLRTMSTSVLDGALNTSQSKPVSMYGYEDPVGDGILKGALIGAGAGAGLMLAANALCKRACGEGPPPTRYVLAIAATSAGIGAVVGWAIDKAHRRRK
jgi:hypothetical protein